MKKIMTVDGNEACSYTSYLFTEVAGIYPITPSSPMAEHIDEWSSAGRKNLFNDEVKVVEMQSEAGAAGMVHGSLRSGVLTTTYTASQGLLLMIPNMYKIAGEMLPGVFHVAARSLSTHALSIFGDHQDVYATRMTGFAMLASSSVQDAAYLAGVSHLAAIKSSVPFLHFFDGFRTSHEIDKIEVLEEADYQKLIDYEALAKFRKKALNPLNPFTVGTAQNDDIYFQATEVRNKYYMKVADIVEDYMAKINKIADTDYHIFNYYGDEKATSLIVAIGSVCETIKETIDELNKENYHVGLVEVHLYRPFNYEYLNKIIPSSVKRVAVLDRTKEAGGSEPLYLDVREALKNREIEIVGGRYGLSSKNTTPAQIKTIYDMLNGELKHPFTIGITDDVTNLSLPLSEFKIAKHDEILIYGYGSDGMVSASKSLIKLVGDNTAKYVQGYFQYDSKKSGGVTVCHLRFGDEKIRSTYYVENPKIIVVTKDTYLAEFELLNNIAPNGTLIINTIKTKDEILDYLSDNDKYIIDSRNIKLYIINAYELARKVGLKNKISTIMESVILKLTNLIDYDFAKEEMKKYAKNRYFKKGDEVVKANYLAIDEASAYLKEIKLENDDYIVEESKPVKDVFLAMTKRKGDMLPVSAFLNHPDGIFEAGTSKKEKRGISDVVPRWIYENCIQCNQCSFVCPHAVIRPYLLTLEEYEKAPEIIKKRAKKPLEKNLQDYYFVIGISVKDCTGCGLCVKTCPSREKALITEELEVQIKEQEQQVFDYLEAHVTAKNLLSTDTLKGSQFSKPKFMFHGACAGCGETAYIKVLTQLFGDSLVISNATGCSSIYGGSAPITPYTVPWASSLFEDNAEYGYGMLIADKIMKRRIKNIMEANMDNPNAELFQKWLDNSNDFAITKDIYEKLDDKTLPASLLDIKDSLVAKTVWTIGGDGWAYDIGFGGIDHVLASGDDVNILVLNSEVYSNTGGQASKASQRGSIAAFAASGKVTEKKDLARMAMSYPNVYVAQVCLGANPMQLIKAFKEAANYHGPSIIIAYAPCISHGIAGGLENSVNMEKLASECGYFPIFRYNPLTETFNLDSKKVDFNLYDEFLNNQTRYSMLYKINPKEAQKLLDENKKEAIRRYDYYKSLVKES